MAVGVSTPSRARGRTHLHRRRSGDAMHSFETAPIGSTGGRLVRGVTRRVRSSTASASSPTAGVRRPDPSIRRRLPGGRLVHDQGVPATGDPRAGESRGDVRTPPRDARTVIQIHRPDADPRQRMAKRARGRPENFELWERTALRRDPRREVGVSRPYRSSGSSRPRSSATAGTPLRARPDGPTGASRAGARPGSDLRAPDRTRRLQVVDVGEVDATGELAVRRRSTPQSTRRTTVRTTRTTVRITRTHVRPISHFV